MSDHFSAQDCKSFIRPLCNSAVRETSILGQNLINLVYYRGKILEKHCSAQLLSWIKIPALTPRETQLMKTKVISKYGKHLAD